MFFMEMEHKCTNRIPKENNALLKRRSFRLRPLTAGSGGGSVLERLYWMHKMEEAVMTLGEKIQILQVDAGAFVLQMPHTEGEGYGTLQKNFSNPAIKRLCRALSLRQGDLI